MPIEPTERDARREWRARFSRFALAEAKPEPIIEVVGARTTVDDGSTTTDVDDEKLIEAVAARLGPESLLDEAARRMLSAMV